VASTRGLRWEAAIPREAVVGAERIVAGEESPADSLSIVVLGAPNVRLRFNRPVHLEGLYGISRVVSEVRLRMDDPDRFVRAMVIPAPPGGYARLDNLPAHLSFAKARFRPDRGLR